MDFQDKLKNRKILKSCKNHDFHRVYDQDKKWRGFWMCYNCHGTADSEYVDAYLTGKEHMLNEIQEKSKNNFDPTDSSLPDDDIVDWSD